MRGLDLLKFRRRQLWRRFLRGMTQIGSFFLPWKSCLRSIEANFGTGVASYFLLIRWLLLLNIVITAVVSVFMILPWEVGKETCPNFSLNSTSFDLNDPVLEGCSASNNSSACDEFCIMKSDRCWHDYRLAVMSTVANHSSQPLRLVQVGGPMTFIRNWMEDSESFSFFQPGCCSRDRMAGTDHRFLRLLPTRDPDLG